MTRVVQKIGQPLLVFATGDIETYDVGTGTWSPVANPQAAGYVPSAKLRSRGVDGPVLASATLTWPTTARWLLTILTTGLNPGPAVIDLKMTAPGGQAVFSETTEIVLERAASA